MIAAWIRRLFRSCQHTWSIIDTYEVIRVRNNSRVWSLFVLQCQKCGDIKRKRIAV